MMQLCGRVLLVTFLIYSKFSDAQNHLRGNNNVLVGPEPRIIGGADVNSTSRYPYYAVLAGSDGDMCGGALIAPDIVLTARHVCSKPPFLP